MRSIFLLGYMGSGKSTIGKSLAKKLSIPFIDIDQYIVNQENMSIKEIFENKGELYFRKAEKKALTALIEDNAPAVISLGGGTPCYFDNMVSLKQSKKFSVYLKASIPTLTQRLFQEKDHRPLIAHLTTEMELSEFIGKHLFERNIHYQQASLIQTIDNKSVEDIVSDIYAELA